MVRRSQLSSRSRICFSPSIRVTQDLPSGPEHVAVHDFDRQQGIYSGACQTSEGGDRRPRIVKNRDFLAYVATMSRGVKNLLERMDMHTEALSKSQGDGAVPHNIDITWEHYKVKSDLHSAILTATYHSLTGSFSESRLFLHLYSLIVLPSMPVEIPFSLLASSLPSFAPC